jgi:hypothetical protein
MVSGTADASVPGGTRGCRRDLRGLQVPPAAMQLRRVQRVLLSRHLLPQAASLHPVPRVAKGLRLLLSKAAAVHSERMHPATLRRLLPEADSADLLPRAQPVLSLSAVRQRIVRAKPAGRKDCFAACRSVAIARTIHAGRGPGRANRIGTKSRRKSVRQVPSPSGRGIG